jgi:dihydroneopterin aldolase
VSDRIRLEGLQLDAEIGVYPHEHGVKQRLVIDVAVETDVREAARLDALERSIDYDALADACRAVCGQRHHRLIETVAERIAARVLETHGARVSRVSVRVAKPSAVPEAASVAVELSRP